MSNAFKIFSIWHNDIQTKIVIYGDADNQEDYRDLVYLYWAELYESLLFVVAVLSPSVGSDSLWPHGL